MYGERGSVGAARVHALMRAHIHGLGGAKVLRRIHSQDPAAHLLVRAPSASHALAPLASVELALHPQLVARQHLHLGVQQLVSVDARVIALADLRENGALPQ